MKTRIQTLSNASFRNLVSRVFSTIDLLMTNTHGARDPFGWDWPTFGVLSPRKAAIWRILIAEGKRRGISQFNDNRLRDRRRRMGVINRLDRVARAA